MLLMGRNMLAEWFCGPICEFVRPVARWQRLWSSSPSKSSSSWSSSPPSWSSSWSSWPSLWSWKPDGGGVCQPADSNHWGSHPLIGVCSLFLRNTQLTTSQALGLVSPSEVGSIVVLLDLCRLRVCSTYGPCSSERADLTYCQWQFWGTNRTNL